MKQALQTLLLCLLTIVGNLSAQTAEDRNLRYIERFKEIAMQEMERSGIPASIKLAQGLLESGSGTSYLARNANNHFGIKCGSNWNGKEVYREDDDYDDKGKLMKSCFRGYRNANASYVAHSEFLRDPKKAFRYGFLFRLNPHDYKRWAEGLRRAGYATDPNYPAKLISRIEKYNLDQYDRLPINDDNFVVDNGNGTGVTRPGTINNPGQAPPNPTPRPTDVNKPIENLVTGFLNTNDVTFFVSDEAISVDEVARRVDISLRKLIEYNEPITSGNQQVNPGQRVFIQKKRSSYRGREQYHTVQPGETLQEISDRYAVRMDKLLKRNRLVSADQRVAPGEKIKLRGGKVKTAPRLGGAPAPAPENPRIPTDENGNLDLDAGTPAQPPVNTDPDANPPITPQPSPPINNPNIGNGKPDFGGEPSPNSAPPNPPVTQPTDPPYTPPPATPQQPTVTPTPQPTPPTTVTPPATEPPPATVKYHNVVKGDTLYNISRRYGLTVDRLKQMNGLTSNTIAIGQRLQVQ